MSLQRRRTYSHTTWGASGSSISPEMADYTDASRFFTPDGLLRGSQAIRRFFAVMFEEFEKPGMSFELLRQEVSGDTAYIVWTAETADNRFRHLHRAERKDSDPNFCGEDFAEALTSALTASNKEWG
jgi:hypothetical protein